MELTMEEKLAAVRGTIIGALAGGHMQFGEGYDYSKHILLQIADFLDITIPQSVIDRAQTRKLITEKHTITKDDAVAWCLEHCVQITFDNGIVSIIDPFIVPEAQTPITAKTFVDAVAKAIRQCK